MARYNNILETIGNTPLVRLNRLAPDHVNLYLKLESFNPLGSVKDRLASALIEAAEKAGDLTPGQTVIEATSGNTGIGLAMVCAQKGYPLVVTMAENNSIERRKLLRFLGAQVVLTPAEEKGTGMINKAIELAEQRGYYLCRQFDNPVNADIHSKTTAQEILQDFPDQSLDYWVSGFGTGGTLKGVSRCLKQHSPKTRIIAAEPDNSPLLGSGIRQPRDNQGNVAASHPQFRPHLMQGWSPDFISGLTEEAMIQGWIDEVVAVNGNDSLVLARRLATQEGIFVGISSGATLAAALKIAEHAEPGSNIVCMAPDTGERYLSTPLFENIAETMTDAEIQLSQSTPGYQFKSSSPTAIDSKPRGELTSCPDTEQLVDQILGQNPVTLFALEWCEFCWSARKLFAALNISYQSIDLDSVAYQTDNLGSKIRRVLEKRTGSKTIPQIFLGGKYLGGSTDLMAAYEDGSLQTQLQDSAIEFDNRIVNVEALLPQWLQPRKTA